MSITTEPLGITYHGQYSSGKTYPFLGLVTDNGNSYLHIALVPTTGNPLPVAPATETTYWALVAKRGEEVELRVTSTDIEWRVKDGTWSKLLSISVMTAARDEAVAAKNAAALSASDAAASKSAAAISASDAESSKLAAAASESNAALSKSAAETSATQANTAKTEAETARDEAQAKVNSIAGMTATIVTLSPSEQATVEVKMEGEYLKLTIGVPQGIQGIQGVQGNPGFSPTITSERDGPNTIITVVDHEGTKTFTIRDGLPGPGTGDMNTNIYDINQNGIVDRAEIADTVAPTATFNQSQVIGLIAALDDKQRKGDYADVVHDHNVSQINGLGEAVTGMLPITDVTLFADDWIVRDDPDDPWEQTVFVGGLLMAFNFLTTYAPGSKKAYQEANISALDTLEDELLTFIASEKPLVDLTARIEARGIPDPNDPAVALHNIDATAHSAMLLDGNAYGLDDSGNITLAQHRIDENAHPNIVIDGNV